MKIFVLMLIFFLTSCASHEAQPAPPPSTLKGRSIKDFNLSIKPYVDQARRSLPQVKQRYQSGLRAEEVLYLTIRLKDSHSKRFEQIYVQVSDWQADNVLGIITSPVRTFDTYKAGDIVNFKEDEILDWMIITSDGKTEGNYVGKFLENYNQYRKGML